MPPSLPVDEIAQTIPTAYHLLGRELRRRFSIAYAAMNHALPFEAPAGDFSIAYAAMNLKSCPRLDLDTFSIAYAAMNDSQALPPAAISFSIAYAAMNSLILIHA